MHWNVEDVKVVSHPVAKLMRSVVARIDPGQRLHFYTEVFTMILRYLQWIEMYTDGQIVFK